ncbi:sulfurtransferase [Algoriphagus taiwanensis]|uniref:Sulfurtransferase n=1 Tax=Algoriphagus taiwanensis TaxID=1445656 RepID=A0ABQ6Q5B4_9BACT|nr:sulfurtransferase [Algoriphagus taiwanensis]
MNSPLISAQGLLKIQDQPDLVLVDARYSASPRQTFEKGHLKRAKFIDPDKELADIKADLALGGRHPLPKAEDFCKVLGDLGINPTSHVVIYDDQKGANASARMWWMMRALSHEKVQVLEGGMQAAVKAGFPISTQPIHRINGTPYPGNEWKLMTATMEEVQAKAWEKDHLIIDVRSEERYRGEFEPIDLVAGHIPGAVNVPLTENMDSDGNFLSPEELREKYLPILEEIPNEQIIVHCGSGVSACHTLLALEHAGLGIPKLYVGSWSEWSRNDKPIGKTLNLDQ